MIKITIDQASLRNVIKNLEKEGKKIEKAAQRVPGSVAQKIAEEMRASAPRKKGKLARSIIVRVEPQSAEVVVTAPYARRLEEGKKSLHGRVKKWWKSTEKRHIRNMIQELKRRTK